MLPDTVGEVRTVAEAATGDGDTVRDKVVVGQCDTVCERDAIADPVGLSV